MKKLSKFLAIIIFMETLISNGTIAMANDVLEDIINEINVDIEETIEIEQQDEIASTSAIEESGGSGYGWDIVNSYTMYSELNAQERHILRSEIGVRGDTMLALCEAGFSISASIKKAIIMQQLDIGVADVLNLINVFGNENDLAVVAENMRMYQLESSVLSEDFKLILPLLEMHKSADEAIDIYSTAKCIGLTPVDIVATEGAIFTEPYINGVSNAVIDDYLDNNDKTLDDLYEEIFLFKNENSLDNATMYSTEEEEEVIDKNYQYGPLSYVNGETGGVNMSSGALSYTEHVVTIPGRNGLDFDLSMTYSSDNRIRYPNSIESNFRNSKYVWQFDYNKLGKDKQGH